MSRQEEGSQAAFYTTRLESQIEELKRSHGLRGVAFFPQANMDASTEEVAEGASAMLDAYMSGRTMDITDSPSAS